VSLFVVGGYAERAQRARVMDLCGCHGLRDIAVAHGFSNVAVFGNDRAHALRIPDCGFADHPHLPFSQRRVEPADNRIARIFDRDVVE
jgi:hypothetical protein